MIARVRVLRDAEADISEAHAWYEEIQPGLGDRFLDAVRGSLAAIAEHPLASRTVHGDLRRTLMPRFPYALFYLVEADHIVILGCFHARRDPSAWKRREREHRDV